MDLKGGSFFMTSLLVLFLYLLLQVLIRLFFPVRATTGFATYDEYFNETARNHASFYIPRLSSQFFRSKEFLQCISMFKIGGKFKRLQVNLVSEAFNTAKV